MNILLLDEDELRLDAGDYRFRHIRTVLKLSVGGRIRAGIVNGSTGTAIIHQMDALGLTLRYEADLVPDHSPTPDPNDPPPVDLLLGHPRPIVLRRMLRDLCTIGVRRLIVTPTQLGERSYLKANMWNETRPMLIEGAAQAGVTRLMEVDRCHSLSQAVRTACGPGQHRVLLHPTPKQSVEAALARAPGMAVLCAVGSERGWTDSEIEVLTAAGFEMADLGDRILRTETAALAVCWMARAAATKAAAVNGSSDNVARSSE